MEDEGKEAWKSLRSQLFELKGFTQAMLGSMLRLIRQNLLIIILLPLLSGGATYMWYNLASPTYSASMTVSYVHLEKKIYADMIVKLNQSILSDGIKGMSGFEALDDEVIESLIEVRAINLKGEELTTDLSDEHIPFDLVVEVRSLAGINELETALQDYLDSPNFVQERLSFNQKKAKDQVEYYSTQVKSLQSKLNVIDVANSPDALELLVDQMNEARAGLSEAEGQLTFNSNIEILHGFQAASAQKNEPGKKRAELAALVGLLLALAIGSFRTSS